MNEPIRRRGFILRTLQAAGAASLACLPIPFVAKAAKAVPSIIHRDRTRFDPNDPYYKLNIALWAATDEFLLNGIRVLRTSVSEHDAGPGEINIAFHTDQTDGRGNRASCYTRMSRCFLIEQPTETICKLMVACARNTARYHHAWLNNQRGRQVA